jgi:hypothetical protein
VAVARTSRRLCAGVLPVIACSVRTAGRVVVVANDGGSRRLPELVADIGAAREAPFHLLVARAGSCLIPGPPPGVASPLLSAGRAVRDEAMVMLARAARGRAEGHGDWSRSRSSGAHSDR